jgi:hypothetical protein
MNRIVYTFFTRNEVQLPKPGRSEQILHESAKRLFHPYGCVILLKTLLDKLSVFDAH